MFLNYRQFIDLLFPPSDDEQILRACTLADFLGALHTQKEHSVISLTRFSDPKIKAAIHLNKFHNHPYAQKLLSALLIAWITSLQAQEYVLIPVPLSAQRQHERGYNQVTEICVRACKALPNCSVATNVLIRTRHTKPQTSLQAKQRRTNLKNAFAIANAKPIAGKHIILIDDVYTTGTTLTSCARILHTMPTLSLTLAAFAH